VPDRYAVIGHPIAHSKSPWIHAQFARATGEDVSYGAIDAPAEGFARAVEQFRAQGGKGLNVTLPFKAEAFALCAQTSARAAEARAVNTLVLDRERLYGDNTDGVGLVRDLRACSCWGRGAPRKACWGRSPRRRPRPS
jgi:shikimate dehydrogenase